jgi:tRNA (cytidine/uridine-2'-O-)-methyltransferase
MGVKRHNQGLAPDHTMFNIVLVHPEIPPNTGNVIRLAANTGCALHLIEPLGFSMEDKQMRRAGLDYREYATVKRHPSWADFVSQEQPALDRCFALTTHGQQSPYGLQFRAGDWLVFGSETSGLPADVRAFFPEPQKMRLPMLEGQRSLNLSNAVAITVYEAWRQLGFAPPA